MEQNYKEEVLKKFGNKIRVRICGICIENNSVLLVKHKHIGQEGIFWAPPGGGLQFGESAVECLAREFREETKLQVKVVNYLFTHEFISDQLHSIELFFLVSIESGRPEKGMDPEFPDFDIIEEVRFWKIEDIKKKSPLQFHQLFTKISDIEDLLSLNGFFCNDERALS